MARSRNIKPGFFTNDVLGELPALARLLFAGLWTICDRDGRCEDRPKRIKAEVLAYDSCDADALLQMLHDAGFILRYEAGGIRVIQVLTWHVHQKPHLKESDSTLPAPEQETTKAGASTNLGRCEQQPRHERARLIPSSLIPSTLIPDSTHTDSSESVSGSASTKAGAICRAMKAANVTDVNPGHPDLLALLDAGATDAEFVWAAQMATERGKGFAYALGVLTKRRTEAAEKAKGMHNGPIPPPGVESFRERAARERVAQMSPALAARTSQSFEVIDGTTKRLA